MPQNRLLRRHSGRGRPGRDHGIRWALLDGALRQEGRQGIDSQGGRVASHGPREDHGPDRAVPVEGAQHTRPRGALRRTHYRTEQLRRIAVQAVQLPRHPQTRPGNRPEIRQLPSEEVQMGVGVCRPRRRDTEGVRRAVLQESAEEDGASLHGSTAIL